MCGFVGIVDQSYDADAVTGALLSINHRGPDDMGQVSLPMCGLGHARLSIIGGADAKQPMWDGSGKVCMVYNGEVYNYKELATQLGFKPMNDTEVVLQAYLKWGTYCFSKFNGMFALAIWDGHTEELILARDRHGIKPLYYTWTKGGGFAFASELKGLLPFLDSPRIDLNALQHYCLYGYTGQHHSILLNVLKVYPGHCVTWHGSSRGLTNDFGNKYALPIVSYDELFRRSIERHLIADVPVGVLLSGGIDSSLIAAYASELHPGIQTFTMGFEEPDLDESKYAKTIAEYLGTTHHEFFITEQDVLDCLDEVVDTFCEPFADSSALPTYALCQHVAGHVKCCLAGDGGDELFGGYPRYWITEKIWENRWWAQKIRPFIPQNSRRMRKLRAALDLRSKDSLFSIYRHTISHFLPEELETTWRYGPVHGPFPDFGKGEPLRNLMNYDLKTYLPGDILVKSDRCSMAHGLELRVPFLDNEFVAGARSIPLKFRRKKKLLRKMLAKKIPQKLWNRPKQGFGIPIEKWLRGPLQQRVFDTLFNSNEEFNRDKLRHYLFDFYHTKNCRYTYKIWNLLMFHLWKERWM